MSARPPHYWRSVAKLSYHPNWVVQHGTGQAAQRVLRALPGTRADLTDRLGYTDDTIRAALKALARLGMIERYGHTWRVKVL